MPGLDLLRRAVRESPGKHIPALFAAAALLACNASGGQTTSDGESAPSLQETPGDGQERLPPRGEAWVIFETDTVLAEIARTASEREEGLMYRESLEDGRGMLFVFSDSQIRSFWMRNTLIPLDIAYLDESLRIVDIQGMEPETDDAHPSARAAMFALEVPRGWFGKKGIEVGTQARVVFGPG
jgi:uncharacterized membrane protein (UPF0127 family)